VLDLAHHVPLAQRTTLELGGAARDFVRADRDEAIADALAWARAGEVPVWILGGGSNVVIADEGLDGLVVEIATRGVTSRREGPHVVARAMAGEPWDPLVERTIAEDLAGLECLSGIPGRVGATPIQNVGAYGQEVADVLHSVRVLDRRDGRIERWSPERCELSYRDSLFKRTPDRFVVLDVELRLRPGGAPTLRYAELQRALAPVPTPSLAHVRDTVIGLRRGKSMVIDPGDPNRRSAGSFFTNPIVDPQTADRVAAEAVRSGVIDDPASMPRFTAPEGKVKLAAGWLVEAAGMRRGHGDGAIGLSTRHALAIVHRGGGTTAELLAFATEVQDRVQARFGVRLQPEPVFMGIT
jgi:UDP-N-acetylmuramate dehydrogenase